MPPLNPPRSELELMDRARGIAGSTFARLADQLHCEVPINLRSHKGWVGQLVETALGASAKNRPEPDFVEVGVELKTIPIDRGGRPRESTFVCSAQLTRMPDLRWGESQVKKKLARVLWIPVEADAALPMSERKVGSPLLWSPTPQDETILQSDWEALHDLICAGYVESITAERGCYLQMRPKAANADARTWGLDDDGGVFETLPRGFYLRRRFIEALLGRHFMVAKG